MLQKETRKIQYHIERDGTFAVENYTQAKPFSNFLPGTAGAYGIPLWAFYVNRGQGISSFGISNKDEAILQFFPANRAYELTPRRGFRTFIRRSGGKNPGYYEPFIDPYRDLAGEVRQTLKVQPQGFSILERSTSFGVEVEVDYFGVPGEPFAALARKTTIRNISGLPQDLEVIDGLPQVVPYGLKEFFLKDMSRTVEAWMVSEIRPGTESCAFFKLKSDPEDRPEYQSVDGAHFYAVEGAVAKDKMRVRPLKAVLLADPEVVFGAKWDLGDPRAFLLEASYEAHKNQVLENKTPCAMSYWKATLTPAEEIVIHSYIGACKDRSVFAKELKRVLNPSYFDGKRKESVHAVRVLQSPATTVSALPHYDEYCRQTFLDNVLRGGIPHPLGDSAGKGKPGSFFYVFSRKHGDLERDYNRFVLQPTYFSQGEGNYRDVNQNRRNDVWFRPEIGELNIRTFMNLIQADGFNPLIVEQVKLKAKSGSWEKKVSSVLAAEALRALSIYLKLPRTPGEIFLFLEGRGVLKEAIEKTLSAVFAAAERRETARHGEGFWCEHWTYNLDLIERYLSLFPERRAALLHGEAEYTFFDNAHRPQPREAKIFKLPDGRIRQYHAVVLDAEKDALIHSRAEDSDKVRTKSGRGEVYRCTLLAKMLIVALNKYASLDPFGAGVEMEAEKPDWYDALNGLPGLFGSSLSVSFELIRWIRFLRETFEGLPAIPKARRKTRVPEEAAELWAELLRATRRFNSAQKSKTRHLDFWDRSHLAKEDYWTATRLGFRGLERVLAWQELARGLRLFEKKIEDGIREAWNPEKDGLCPTYLWHEVTASREIKAVRGKKLKEVHPGWTRVKPLAFRQRKLAPFLEGPMHALKTAPSSELARKIYDGVRRSDLYDRKLGMYRVTSNLSAESPEIGRARVFAPGWLENESIFLHMEYKWLLEVLKKGLHEEFFTDFKSALVAFQDPAVYGRSIFENSSFIASSAFVDKRLHGTGFVARLSGSTAEFLDMWLRMNLGSDPFRLNAQGKLEARLEPVLPEWLFTREETSREIQYRDGSRMRWVFPQRTYAFLAFGQTLVVYHNRKLGPTYGPRRVLVTRMEFLDEAGKPVTIHGSVLEERYARLLREGRIRRLDAELS